MRISDWSSDVCSSDLLRRRHHAGSELAHRAVERVLRDVGDGQLGAFGGEVAAEIVADVPHALDGDAQAFQAVDAEPVPGGGADAPVDAVGGGGRGIADAALGDAGDVRGLARHDRSEEHTSELQSLMRISYA